MSSAAEQPGLRLAECSSDVLGCGGAGAAAGRRSGGAGGAAGVLTVAHMQCPARDVVRRLAVCCSRDALEVHSTQPPLAGYAHDALVLVLFFRAGVLSSHPTRPPPRAADECATRFKAVVLHRSLLRASESAATMLWPCCGHAVEGSSTADPRGG